MRFHLFDDAVADGWFPFALTRPIGELRLGAGTLRGRAEMFAGVPAGPSLTRPWLAGFRESGSPGAAPRSSGPPNGPLLLLSSRFVPTAGSRLEKLADAVPVLLLCEGAPVGAYIPPGHEAPDEAWLLDPGPLPGAAELRIGGGLLAWPWSLIERNAEILARDVAEAAPPGSGPPPDAPRIGDGPVILGPDTRVEPGVLFDTREGGIRLDARCEVRTGSRLAGPLHAGPESRLLGGAYSAVSAGPRSYLRGEIEDSIVLGFSNKAHDGFLGHAYLGRWVNLGAGTTNSDLKNNYGTVRVGPPDAEVDTGLVKLGCLIGDHVKTAIGTLLNTGTVVGAGANLFGDGRPARWIPPFAWGQEAGAPAYARDRFVETAALVMARRGVECDDTTRGYLAACWDLARSGAGA